MSLSRLDKPLWLENNFISAWKKLPRCVNCVAEFIVEVRGTDIIQRPHLLDCGHNICEKCLFSNKIETLKCKECHHVTFIRKHQTIRESVFLSYHLFGELSYLRFTYPRDLKHNPKVQPMKNGKLRYECSECNESYTDHCCTQCGVPYCKDCFIQIHKFGKTLQTHTLTMFDPKQYLPKRKCVIHKRNFVLYCLKCATTVCPDCAAQEHRDHRKVSIFEKNKKSCSKINSTLVDLEKSKDVVKQALKDVTYVEKKHEDYVQDTINNVSDFFQMLHGSLQVLERRIMLEIKNNGIKLLSETEEKRSSLERTVGEYEELTTKLKASQNPLPQNFLIDEMIAHVKDKMSENNLLSDIRDTDGNPFKIIKMRDSKDIICNLISVDFTHKPAPAQKQDYEYYLQNVESCTDLNTTFESQLLDTTHEKTIIEKRKNYTINTKASKGSNSSKQDNKNRGNSEQTRHSKIAHSQKVNLSHIKNPQCFYVQNQSFLSAALEFQEACSDEASYAASPSYIDQNEMYLVLNATDHKWYRGLVTESMNSSKMYKVFLLDYGNTLQVPQQRFKEISEDLKLRPPGAIKCALFGIRPKGGSWPDSANHFMSEIVLNQPVSMFVVSEGNPNLVDLMTIHHKYPVSIRDALLFADEAKSDKISDDKIQEKIDLLIVMKRKSNIASTKKYFKNVFHVGESFRGEVLRIISPEEFYAAKFDHRQEIKEIQNQLNKEYQKMREKIYQPKTGMICAAFINNVWYRAQIVHVFPIVNCKVRLVDEGIIENVTWKQLRVLDEKYISINEASVKCSLADIAPLQQNGYTWTDQCKAEFQRLVMNPFLQLFIHGLKDNTYIVGLYIIKKNVDININALLVKYKHADSTGTESLCVEFPKKNTIDKNVVVNRNEKETIKEDSSDIQRYGVKVKITNIISPGEFYVRLAKQITGINSLHSHIQEHQKNKLHESGPIRRTWEINDKCLVRTDLRHDKICQWYRAVIVDVYEKDRKRFYTVYLRDQGIFHSDITYDCVAPIDNIFDRVTDGAIRCRLACVKPTGEDWSSVSRDEFRVLAYTFEELSASIQGAREGTTIPVILWGMSTECDDPLSPATCKWININKSLVNCGFVDLSEKFSPTYTNSNEIESEMANGKESFADWISAIEKKMKENDDDDSTSYYDEAFSQINDLDSEKDSKESATAWLPPKPIDKYIFTCVPTYVDMECVIYLHDTSQDRLLENMKALLNKSSSERTEESEKVTKDWSVGDVCLARYHLDSFFYRAIIVDMKPNKLVNVQFIDYGNIEECKLSDLRKKLSLTKIPMQASKYTLDGIKPKGKESKWPVDTLDFIHAQIVGKTATIRVSDNQENVEVKKCSLTVDGVDIAELLITMNVAEKITKKAATTFTPAVKKEIKTHDDLDEYDYEGDAFNILSVSQKSDELAAAVMDEEDYRKIFEKMEIDTFCRTVANDDENNDPFDMDFEESVYSVPLFNQDLHNFDDPELLPKQEQQNSVFGPGDTSTSYDFIELQTFKPLILSQNITGFYCETTTIIDCMDLYVCPHLSHYEKQFSEMSKRIQTLAKTCKTLKDVEQTTPCLAKYKADGLWYRAVVREYFPETETANILYVDYLNSEVLPVSEVKECPKYLLDFPLRNIQIKLNGVRRNFRYRSSDIRRQLAVILDKRRIFAKVIRNDEQIVAELYDSHHEKCLLYEDLIQKNFLIKIRP